MDEIVRLYPPEVGGPMAQSRMDTLEQGTQTLGCGSHWSYSDFSSAQSDPGLLGQHAQPVSAPLTTPAQHLRAVGESLPAKCGPRKRWNAKRDTHEVPQTQMMERLYSDHCG